MPYDHAERSPIVTEMIERIRAIGPTLRSRAVEADRAGRLSDQTIADLDAAGAFNIASPAEFGGYELSVREQLDIISEVAKWDGSCGWCVWAAAGANWIQAGCGKRVVEEVYSHSWVGPRVAGSSHFPATRGRARRTEGGWIISGGPWTFATGSLWAPYTNLGCIAEDGEAAGQVVGVQVAREQLRFLDDWQAAGMRGTGSVSVMLRDGELFVPEYRVVPDSDIASGAREHGLMGSLWKVPPYGWSFSLMIGMSIGIAQGALDRFLERSAGRPIRDTSYKDQLAAPMTHLMLADVYMKIRSATLLAQTNAAETDRMGILAKSDKLDATELKTFVTRLMVETAHATKWCAEAIELLQKNSGSTAIMESEPIQRAWRDARVITLHGVLHLDPLAENLGRMMAGVELQQFDAGTLDFRQQNPPAQAA